MIKEKLTYKETCVSVRRISFEKEGEKLEIHCHFFPHLMVNRKGYVKVRTYLDDRKTVEHEVILGPGDDYQVDRNKVHDAIAMSDDSAVDCIFAHRDRDGVVVDQYEGNYQEHLNTSFEDRQRLNSLGKDC